MIITRLSVFVCSYDVARYVDEIANRHPSLIPDTGEIDSDTRSEIDLILQSYSGPAAQIEWNKLRNNLHMLSPTYRRFLDPFLPRGLYSFRRNKKDPLLCLQERLDEMDFGFEASIMNLILWIQEVAGNAYDALQRNNLIELKRAISTARDEAADPANRQSRCPRPGGCPDQLLC